MLLFFEDIDRPIISNSSPAIKNAKTGHHNCPVCARGGSIVTVSGGTDAVVFVEVMLLVVVSDVPVDVKVEVVTFVDEEDVFVGV